MSRRQHPLDGFLASSIKAESETWPLVRQSGLGWRVTLSNEHQDTYTKEGTFPYVPTFHDDWAQFWQSVARQTLWEQHLLVAAPIVRTFTDDLALAISQIRLDRDWWQEEVGIVMTVWNNKALIEAMQTLTVSEFAAVQHLSKERLLRNS